MSFMMKRIMLTWLLIAALSGISASLGGQTLTAMEIVKKTDDKFRGEQSGFSVMTMTIVRPSWQRTVEFKSWTKEDDYALTLITAPAREKGQSFLKRKTEMWSWNPAINRLVKLPPSMMSQGWMGSDYTNDDILRESSVVDDYNHSMEGTEIIDGHECWKIKLLAKEDADVLWGHQVWWIDRNEYIALKAELYDEDGYLVRSEKASELKMMDGRLIPTVLELVPAENEGYKTIVKIIEIKFNIKIEESFFSQQNMKTIR